MSNDGTREVIEGAEDTNLMGKYCKDLNNTNNCQISIKIITVFPLITHTKSIFFRFTFFQIVAPKFETNICMGFCLFSIVSPINLQMK